MSSTESPIRTDLLDERILQTKRELVADVLEGTVPATVAGFGELHDHVDANTYGGLCDGPPWGVGFGWTETGHVHFGETCALQDAIHEWIVGGGLVRAVADQIPG